MLGANRFELEYSDKKKIGRGGYASVYKARNHLDGHYYAIKKVKLALKQIRKNVDREILRILDEAKVLAKVNHKNILRYYNSWLEGVPNQDRHSHNPSPKRSRFANQTQENSGSSRGSSISVEGSDVDEDEDSFLEFEKPAHEKPRLDSSKFKINALSGQKPKN
mmetsp:Transcript_39268/g.34953  ORF Transcript_39268/g.34953 Transcript_39268/m.34953 type:complete len:164 (-) Transcript_39268:1437-1928(-)